METMIDSQVRRGLALNALGLIFRTEAGSMCVCSCFPSVCFCDLQNTPASIPSLPPTAQHPIPRSNCSAIARQHLCSLVSDCASLGAN
eukprot:3400206-Rhodomonas_salina.1